MYKLVILLKAMADMNGMFNLLNAHEDNVMLDRLAEENFRSVYSSQALNWITEIASGRYVAQPVENIATNEPVDSETTSTNEASDNSELIVTAEQVAAYGSVKNAIRHVIKQ